MDLQFKKSQGTMENNPDGIFVAKDNIVTIIKNSQRITQEMGESTIELWEFDIWKGQLGIYVQSNEYVNKTLQSLPQNQLVITQKIYDSEPESVIVTSIENDTKWDIVLRNNIVLNDDSTYSCDELNFNRYKINQALTANDVKQVYLVNNNNMFEMALCPESMIQKNRTSAIDLKDSLFATYNVLLNKIDALETRIEALEV